MLAGQLQDGVHALITELKTMFFKSKGYFIIFFVCADEQKKGILTVANQKETM